MFSAIFPGAFFRLQGIVCLLHFRVVISRCEIDTLMLSHALVVDEDT